MTYPTLHASMARAARNVQLPRFNLPSQVGRTDARSAKNPYLSEFLALPESYHASHWQGDYREREREREFRECRQRMVERFSWAVPNDAAITAIARHAPRLLEIGAGSGYWAHLLSQAGVDVVAYDLHPPANTWHPIGRGGIETIRQQSDRALLICWPPRLNSMAIEALRAFQGATLVYVGEFMRGNADAWFFVELWHHWYETERVEIPRWFNRLDDLRIFKRAPSSTKLCPT